MEIIRCPQGAQRPVDVVSAPTGAAAETAPGRAQCTTSLSGVSLHPLSEGSFPACHFGKRQRERVRLIHVKTFFQKSRRARCTLILGQTFLTFLLFRFFVRIEFPGNYGSMTFYLDFSFLLAAFCVPVAFIGEVESEPLPLKTDKALLLYFQYNPVAGFRVEPFFS